MIKLLLPLLAITLFLAGCGSYWTDQGAASRTSAEARLRQAEAARQNAQAAIIDAEARGALAASQAEALRSTIDANSDLMHQAVRLADNSEYVWLFAGLAFGVLGFAGWAIWAAHRRPAAAETHAAARQIATIETMQSSLRLVQEPGETHAAFLLRVNAAAFAAAEREQRMIDAPEIRALTRT